MTKCDYLNEGSIDLGVELEETSCGQDLIHSSVPSLAKLADKSGD